MAKRDAALEKRTRNEEDADKHKGKAKRDKERGRTANWCRIAGHPLTCSCNLPSRDEIIEASRARR